MKAAFLVLGLFGSFGLGVLASRIAAIQKSTPNRFAVEDTPRHKKSDINSPLTPPLEYGSKASFDLLETISSIPIDRIAEGDNALSGRVRAEIGEPLPGVLVYAVLVGAKDQREEGWSEFRPRPVKVDEPDFRSRVMAVIEKERLREAGRHVATTDENGIFKLTGLAESKYLVQGRVEGFEVEAREAKAGTEIELVALALADVQVSVLLPDGTEADEAHIHLRKASRYSDETMNPWSYRKPVLRLRPGMYKLRATKGDSEDLRSEIQDVSAQPGVPPLKVVFKLTENAGIKGKVVFPKGEEHHQVIVYLLPVTASGIPSFEELLKSEQKQAAELEGGFTFAFKDLTPGKYLVAGTRADNVFDPKIVDVADRMVTLDLVPPPLTRSDYAVLWVLGPDGNPLPDVSISTWYTYPMGTMGAGVHPIRRDDSSFWMIYMSPSEEKPGGKYEATVESERYGKKEVEYTRSAYTEKTVKFEEPARLEVALADFNADARGFSLNVIPAGENPAWGGEAPSDGEGVDREGRQVFGPLRPGEYQVVVNFHVQRRAQHYLCSGGFTPVTLSPGMNRISVTAPDLYKLAVQVDEQDRDGWLYISPAGKGDYCWRDDERIGRDGLVVFNELIAGDYVLSRWEKEKPDAMLVSVPSSEPIRFSPRHPDALLVKIEEAGGHLATAGLQSGDLIVEIGGKPLTGIDPSFSIDAVAWAFRSEPEVEVIVFRGKDRFETRLEPAKLKVERLRGGELIPTSRP
jgi:hypothetical protein